MASCCKAAPHPVIGWLSYSIRLWGRTHTQPIPVENDINTLHTQTDITNRQADLGISVRAPARTLLVNDMELNQHSSY